MKKRILLTMMFALCAILGRAQSVDVFIYDSDGPFSNVRNKPNGKIVDKIPVNASASLLVEKVSNGWWRIVGDTYNRLRDEIDEDGEEWEDVMLKGSTTGYWIHYSVIGTGTRNYGNEKLPLRSQPSKRASISYTLTGDQVVRPIDVQGDWVKVKTLDGKGVGWVEDEWLCSNPVTTCP